MLQAGNCVPGVNLGNARHTNQIKFKLNVLNIPKDFLTFILLDLLNSSTMNRGAKKIKN